MIWNVNFLSNFNVLLLTASFVTSKIDVDKSFFEVHPIESLIKIHSVCEKIKLWLLWKFQKCSLIIVLLFAKIA